MLSGTVYTIPHRESADGRLRACGLEFAAIGQDFSTKRGAIVKVIGSYYVRKIGSDSFGWALKLGIFDGFGWSNPVPPNHAFVRAKSASAPELERTRKTAAETPGYALIVGTIDESAVSTLKAIPDQRHIVLGFNRAPGQQDVVIPVDLTVQNTQMEGDKPVRQRSHEMVNDFTACVSALLQ